MERNLKASCLTNINFSNTVSLLPSDVVFLSCTGLSSYNTPHVDYTPYGLISINSLGSGQIIRYSFPSLWEWISRWMSCLRKNVWRYWFFPLLFILVGVWLLQLTNHSKSPNIWTLVMIQDIWSLKGFASSFSALRGNTKTSSVSAKITASSAKSWSVILLLPTDVPPEPSPFNHRKVIGYDCTPASLPNLQERRRIRPPFPHIFHSTFSPGIQAHQ